MSRGVPLTDYDRGPWLSALHARMLDFFDRGQDLVVGCSALREKYREELARGIAIRWVYLRASPALIRSRLSVRKDHFMKVDMLDSQFDVLEEPSDAIVVDAGAPLSAVIDRVVSQLADIKSS